MAVMVLLALSALTFHQVAAAPSLQARVDNHGLSLSVGGVPVVRGAWFQVYAPGWTKGYFSSIYADPKIKQIDPNTTEVTYESEDHKTHAVETYAKQGNQLKVHYDFLWNSSELAKIEMTPGLLWAPALEKGKLIADGQPGRSMLAKTYGTQDVEVRRFAPDASKFSFAVPFCNLGIESSLPLTLFDGRDKLAQDWAEGRELFWLGTDDITLEQGKVSSLDVTWSVTPPSSPEVADLKPMAPAIGFSPSSLPSALQPVEEKPLLIPKPRRDLLDFELPTEITGRWSFPAGRFLGFEEFQAALRRRFIFPALNSRTPAIKIDAGISELHTVSGAYRITIHPGGVSVVGEQEEGLRAGLERLAQLAFIRDGKIMLPTGELYDEPVTAWRGVHLFVGPQALEFQTKLWERVLRPLGFNKVVLQCERTDWECLPGIETSETMSRADLVKLFTMYRGLGVEPIPLIQSFGHDEWLFANGKNRDVAMEPDNPHAFDPRKPRTKELLNQLWDEAFDLLHPTTIHFGCDEVDLRGYPTDPAVKTQLWNMQMPVLGDIANRHHAKMIFWGDQLLAPDEAPDATFGDTDADAASRRAAMPKGAYIGDWHYKADPNPETFRKSLTVLSESGLKPIASVWYRPENVHGFDLAAVAGGFGTLQTTWAGYTSNERAMVENLSQFSAMVLAADYSWSGRQTDLPNLGYDPSEVFRKMYFGRPQSPSPLPGLTFGPSDGHEARIGSTDFRIGSPIQLASTVDPATANLPLTVTVPLEANAKSVAFALSSSLHLDDGEPIGELEVLLESGRKVTQPLSYGSFVRNLTDTGVSVYSDRSNGISSFTIDLGTRTERIRSVTLRESNNYVGLKLFGITAY